MKNIYGPYFILIIHLLTLTIRIYFKNFIESGFQLQTRGNEINILLNELLKIDKNFDSGKLNIISFLNFILFIIIGYNFVDSIITIILTISILEGFLIFYNENGQLLSNLIISLIGYFIGIILKNKNKNKKYERNMNRLIENQYSGI